MLAGRMPSDGPDTRGGGGVCSATVSAILLRARARMHFSCGCRGVCRRFEARPRCFLCDYLDTCA